MQVVLILVLTLTPTLTPEPGTVGVEESYSGEHLLSYQEATCTSSTTYTLLRYQEATCTSSTTYTLLRYKEARCTSSTTYTLLRYQEAVWRTWRYRVNACVLPQWADNLRKIRRKRGCSEGSSGSS